MNLAKIYCKEVINKIEVFLKKNNKKNNFYNKNYDDLYNSYLKLEKIINNNNSNTD